MEKSLKTRIAQPLKRSRNRRFCFGFSVEISQIKESLYLSQFIF